MLCANRWSVSLPCRRVVCTCVYRLVVTAPSSARGSPPPFFSPLSPLFSFNRHSLLLSFSLLSRQSRPISRLSIEREREREMSIGMYIYVCISSREVCNYSLRAYDVCRILRDREGKKEETASPVMSIQIYRLRDRYPWACLYGFFFCSFLSTRRSLFLSFSLSSVTHAARSSSPSRFLSFL